MAALCLFSFQSNTHLYRAFDVKSNHKKTLNLGKNRLSKTKKSIILGVKQFMKPKIQSLDYTYKKPNTDVWVLNTDDIPVNKDLVGDVQLVHLAPGSIGGNHKHSRREWFIGIGDLIFVWLDAKGNAYQEHMHPKGQILLISVPPYLPHAVANISKNKVGILYEMADRKMKDSEPVKVYESIV